MTPAAPGPVPPRLRERKELARYLLGRGLDGDTAAPSVDVLARAAGEAPAGIAFPAGLAPMVQPIPAGHDPQAVLPRADVVVVTWTVDELAGLAQVFCGGRSASGWAPYAHNFESKFARLIRPFAPASGSRRLGSFQPVTVGSLKVLLVKSELHLNQDGISTGVGRATLPVKNLFRQIFTEVRPKYVFTVGTAGSVFPDFQLGDVVITRAARFRLQQEFRNEPFKDATFTSDWPIPTSHLGVAEELMAALADELVEPPFAPPTARFPFDGPPIVSTPANRPDIKLEQDGRDAPEFHPILSTDFFEYGTTTNRLDRLGVGLEMGDAALGLAASELKRPPRWAAIRNFSDPVINGALSSSQFHLNPQTTWAVGYYTAYGRWTSAVGALATWGVIAGLPEQA